MAPMPVIDPVAVANVEALLAAIPPDRELDEPGKDVRETTIELPSVDLAGDQPDNVDAAAWPVTAGTVRMGGLEPGQDPGPVQEIVDQGIDRDQVHADFQPPRANISGTNQNARQGHGEPPCPQRRRRCATAQPAPCALVPEGPKGLGR